MDFAMMALPCDHRPFCSPVEQSSSVGSAWECSRDTEKLADRSATCCRGLTASKPPRQLAWPTSSCVHKLLRFSFIIRPCNGLA